MSKYVVGITGASGSIYAIRLLEELLKRGNEIHLVCSKNGDKVLEYETGYNLITLKEKFNEFDGNITIHDNENLFAPIASGSFKTEGMIILPCSMATLGEIALGVSKNLLGRAADVCIKEKRKLIVVPRETPLSTIHLRNMLSLSELGTTILPAMPGFYQRPQSMEELIDFVVGKILDVLNIDNKLFTKWGN